MLLSTGRESPSLSPPATACHMPRGRGGFRVLDCLPRRLWLGPRVDGRPAGCRRRCRAPDCRWRRGKICAIGSWMWCQLLPRLISSSSSCATTVRSPLVGSIHMSVAPIGATCGQVDARLPAVDRLGELGREEERFVLVVGRHGEARSSGAARAAGVAFSSLILAAVLAAPQRPALRLLAVVGQHAVAGFDQRIDAVRVAADRAEIFPSGDSGSPCASLPLRTGARRSTSRRRRPGLNRPLPARRWCGPQV